MKKPKLDQVKVDLPKQEEAPKTRTVAEIQQEYTGLCAQAGNLQYQIFTLGKDLEILNSRLRDLNFEAAASKAKESEQSNG